MNTFKLMKFISLSIIIFSFYLLIGCKQDNSLDPNAKITTYDSAHLFRNNGTINGVLINGQAWTHPKDWKTDLVGIVSKPVTGCNSFFAGIELNSYEQDNIDTIYYYQREHLLITGIPLLKKATYLITQEYGCGNLYASLFLLGEDGDAIVGYYKRLDAKGVSNTITIDSFDTISGDVSGSFDITFVKDRLNKAYYPNYPDTVRFNGGTFKTKWLLK